MDAERFKDLVITDIHTHGIKGLSTETSSPEELLEIAKVHFSLGTRNIILSIYPGPIEKMRTILHACKKAMEIQSKVSGSLDTARILGVHLEGPFLNKKKAGALDKRFFLSPNEKKLEELIDGFNDIVKMITLSPELNGAAALIRTIVKKGIIVGMGHSDATYTEAEEGYKNGAKYITHIFNAMRGIHHREVGIAGFGLLNEDIYVEAIGDLEHVDLNTLRLIFTLKKKNRIVLVSDSYSGTLCIDQKRKKGSKLKGGCYPLAFCLQRLFEKGFPEDDVIASVTKNPMEFLKSISL
ncbi:MAG: hypothetical protein N2513_00175 [Deltaproteobacteria bacterium]|nr:hypothetical protein [Deltaproteobacteria bacterium]